LPDKKNKDGSTDDETHFTTVFSDVELSGAKNNAQVPAFKFILVEFYPPYESKHRL
jgi:hypothetical protein